VFLVEFLAEECALCCGVIAFKVNEKLKSGFLGLVKSFSGRFILEILHKFFIAIAYLM
jgi:hypothetical protein